MALHKVDRERNKLICVEHATYAGERWRERHDFQPLLRDNPEVLDPDLLIVAEEFNEWEGSSRRIDLLGLDKEGNLVVLELKREDDGGHMELQAVRYAAMVSSMDFEAVVHIYESRLAKCGKDATTARQEIEAFLADADEPAITNQPRIILVAPNFSREITTTVLWLNDQGLGIRCIAANIYKIQEEYYLQIDQVIPLPSAVDYQFKIREKSMRAKRHATVRRRGRSLEILIDKGLLTAGTPIHLLRPPRPGLVISDERAKRATFQAGDKFVWEYDGNAYALSKLCKTIVEEFGGDVLLGSFPGPDFWALDGETVSLAKRAREIEAATD